MSYAFLLCTALVMGQAPEEDGLAKSVREPVQTWRVVEPEEVAQPPQEADLAAGQPALEERPNPRFRSLMLAAGGLTAALAVLVWTPALAIGPPTFFAVGINAVATAADIVQEQARRLANLRIRVDSPPDAATAMASARQVNVGALLLAALAAARAVNWVEVLSNLSKVQVHSVRLGLQGIQLPSTPTRTPHLDPQPFQYLAMGVVFSAVVTLGVVLFAAVTVMPLVFFGLAALAV